MGGVPGHSRWTWGDCGAPPTIPGVLVVAGSGLAVHGQQPRARLQLGGATLQSQTTSACTSPKTGIGVASGHPPSGTGWPPSGDTGRGVGVHMTSGAARTHLQVQLSLDLYICGGSSTYWISALARPIWIRGGWVAAAHSDLGCRCRLPTYMKAVGTAT